MSEEDIFFDLGSGSGKGIFAASMLFPFKKCIGIEILEGLYNISLDMKKEYETNVFLLKFI